MELTVLPVPSRIGSTTEFQESQRWMDRFAQEFAEFFEDWLPTWAVPLEVLQRVKIPQVDFFSFGEKLPVVEQGVSDPSGMGYAYNQIARVLDDDFRTAHEVLDLREKRSKTVLTSLGGQYEYDVYVSYPQSAYLQSWIDEFHSLLQAELTLELGRETSIFVDRREITLGSSWPDQTIAALRQSRMLLPILTPAYFRSRWTTAEWATFEARERETGVTPLIFPVVVSGRDRLPEAVVQRQYVDATSELTIVAGPRSATYPRTVQMVRRVATDLLHLLTRVPPFDTAFPLVQPNEPELRNLDTRYPATD